jgi:hypothetical protein
MSDEQRAIRDKTCIRFSDILNSFTPRFVWKSGQ